MCAKEAIKRKEKKRMRDFEWGQDLWAVIKEDGTYSGVPCLTEEEAHELARQHEGARIFRLVLCDERS